MPALDWGRCCHFKVPDREGMAALGEGLGAGVGELVGVCIVDIAFLLEPKPVNSGTSSTPAGLLLEGVSLVVFVEIGVNARTLTSAEVLRGGAGDCVCDGRDTESRFSGEIDRAYSVATRQ